MDVGCMALSSTGFWGLSSHNALTSSLIHDHVHSLEVVSLYFDVGDRAVPLRGPDPAVTEKILDGDEICIGIE